MKTSTIIRFVLAAFFATLACVGLLFGITGIVVLWALAWLLLMGRSELTKPIPRKELWPTFLGIGVFLAVLLTLPFLHLPSLPEPHGIIRAMFAVAMWVLWMFVVYHRWRRERRKADA
jgi:predicted lysophospholipase L1 biosynthesis ABC-type transport system permease subunit